MPAPSPVVEPSVTVPPSGVPGSVRVIVGAVLSTVRPVVVELDVLPAPSVAVARTSQAPSATEVVFHAQE